MDENERIKEELPEFEHSSKAIAIGRLFEQGDRRNPRIVSDNKRVWIVSCRLRVSGFSFFFLIFKFCMHIKASSR